MNKGAWVFLIAAGGYILFELSLLQRFGYRMETDHILEKMVSADEAARRCGGVTRSQEKAYQAKFNRLTQRITRELNDSTDVGAREVPGVHPDAHAADTDTDSHPDQSQASSLHQSDVSPTGASTAEVANSQILNHRETIRALVAAEGCDSKTMRSWRRQYTVYAGKP